MDSEDTDSTREYTTIEFRGTTAATNSSIFEQTKPILKVPLGMLIVRIEFSFYFTGIITSAISIIAH